MHFDIRLEEVTKADKTNYYYNLKRTAHIVKEMDFGLTLNLSLTGNLK
jgi:hypothetical protein